MKAAIFDMDGTMVDNMMVHHRAWLKKLAELGLELTMEEAKEKLHGINEDIVKTLFGDRFTPEERRQISWEKEAAYREIFLPDLALVPGCAQLLEDLHASKTPMAVASAAPPENVDFVLDNLSLRHYFQAVFHAKSVEKGKPHPEIYLKTTDALGLDPADCLVFEDTPVGAQAASAAGCKVIVLTTTHLQGEFTGISNVLQFIQNFEGLALPQLH